MSPKAFIALLLVTTAAVGGAVWTSLDRPAVAVEERTGERLYPQLAARANDVARIEVTEKGRTTVVARTEAGWTMPDKADHPVRIEPVRELVAALAQLTVVEGMTTQPDRFPRLDVQDPAGEQDRSKRVVLKRADGTVLADLVAGKTIATLGGSGGLYVRDQGRAWLVQGRVPLPYEPMVWLDRQAVDVGPDRLAEVKLMDGGTVLARLAREGDGALALDEVPEGREGDKVQTDRVAGLFERMIFEDVRAAAGLAADASGRWAEAGTKDGLVLRARPAREGDQVWWLLSAEAGATASDEVRAEAERLNAHLARFAYKLPVWKVEVLNLPPEILTRARQS